jgi:hypothetical protein
MMRANVAIACCRRSGDAEPTDLYPDPDAAPLRAAFGRLGARSTLVAWDDPDVRWASFSHVLVSSTWDSVDRPAEYLAWTRRVSTLSTLSNPHGVVEWNFDKSHQRELASDGVPVVPTTWVGPHDSWEAPRGADFVVKPSISAGGRNTARYAGGDPAASAHVRALQQAGQTVMVQEYLQNVDEYGELDLIFVAGTFSHAVVKKPALRTGEGVLERPWERMAWSGLEEPTGAQLAVAELTMRSVLNRFGEPPVYGRVDLVKGPTSWLVLEVELVDPYLSLDLKPPAATELAHAVIHAGSAVAGVPR